MKIHQALHGYDRGHRLLAASVELPRSASRQLAIQSDLSGSASEPEFDGYLSGYRIEDTRFYAFARTWYATEQSRPGCVWTHTLMLDIDQLQKLRGSACTELLRRPNGLGDEAAYAAPLSTTPHGCMEHVTNPNAAAIVSAVFNADSRPVLIPAENSIVYEGVLLALWDMQWPELRSTFSFSTGSFANRQIKKTFDVQVVPSTLLRRLSREVKEAIVVEPTKGNSQNQQEWTHRVVNELAGRDLEKPLCHFTQNVKNFPTSRAFFPLAVTLSTERTPYDARTLLEAIRGTYANSSSAASINSTIVDVAFDPSQKCPLGVNQRELIGELCMDSANTNVENLERTVVEKATALGRANEQLAIDVLADITNKKLNETGVRVARAFMESIPRTPEVISALQESLPVMASIDPEVCTLPQVWSGTYRQQHDLFDAVSQHADIAEETKDRIVLALLDADNTSLARVATRRFGSRSIHVVLNWFNAPSSRKSLQRSWRDELRFNESATLEWLAATTMPLQVKTVVMLSTFVDPTQSVCKTVPGRVWLSALQHDSDESTSNVNRASCFLFALAIRSNSEEYARVAALTFDRVHRLVMNDEFGYEEWAWLSDMLPSLGFMWNWDKAERLRRGFIAQFKSRQWPVDLFASASGAGVTWSQLIDSCRHTDEGRWLLTSLRNQLNQGAINLTPQQAQEL